MIFVIFDREATFSRRKNTSDVIMITVTGRYINRCIYHSHNMIKEKSEKHDWNCWHEIGLIQFGLYMRQRIKSEQLCDVHKIDVTSRVLFLVMFNLFPCPGFGYLTSSVLSSRTSLDIFVEMERTQPENNQDQEGFYFGLNEPSATDAACLFWLRCSVWAFNPVIIRI